MNIEAVAAYLAASACGVVGKTIFATEMPTACKEGILLMGPYYGTPINRNLPGYYNTEFRVVVRSTSYDPGMALATKALKALDTSLEVTMGTMIVKQITPQNLPRPYRRSAGAYWEFEMDVEIAYVETAT